MFNFTIFSKILEMARWGSRSCSQVSKLNSKTQQVLWGALCATLLCCNFCEKHSHQSQYSTHVVIGCGHPSLYLLIKDFGKSQNNCKWFKFIVQFVTVITCVCAKLVRAAHANRFIKSHWIYICVFLILNMKTMSLSSLKIMKISPITEYSDIHFFQTKNEPNCSHHKLSTNIMRWFSYLMPTWISTERWFILPE
jgi:hypothetical protein